MFCSNVIYYFFVVIIINNNIIIFASVMLKRNGRQRSIFSTSCLEAPLEEGEESSCLASRRHCSELARSLPIPSYIALLFRPCARSSPIAARLVRLRLHHGGHTDADVFRHHRPRLPLVHHLPAVMLPLRATEARAASDAGFPCPASLVSSMSNGTETMHLIWSAPLLLPRFVLFFFFFKGIKAKL